MASPTTDLDQRRRVPRWERAVAELLSWAQREVCVLGACTPLNLHAELAALADDFGRGAARKPRFVYAGAATPRQGDARAALERAADSLDGVGPLAALYAARARELALEAEICAAAGSARLEPLAQKRFAARDQFDADAGALCDAWLDAGGDAEGAWVWSDDDGDPRSLLCRMRSQVGRERLAMRVAVSDRLAPLAATGGGIIYVAARRRVRVSDVERTVLHEIEGHARPRMRAARQPLGLPARGTARGSDEQEGRALALEEHAGALDGPRRRELARRHLAGRCVRAGADFVDTVRALTDRHAPLGDALRIAARAHRGGGLARELVYLPAYLRVRAALAADPTLDALLGQGQIALDAAAVLRPWLVCHA